MSSNGDPVLNFEGSGFARRLRIPLLLRGSALSIEIEQHRVTYSVQSGNPVTAQHYGQEFTVGAGSPASFAGYYKTLDSPPASPISTETVTPCAERSDRPQG